MPKRVSTKRRKNDDVDQYDDLGLPMSKSETADKGNEEKKDVDINALMTQIASLGVRLDTAERTNMALMTQAPKVQSIEQTKVDLKGLPDPSLDPEGYAKALNEQITNTITANQRAVNSQTQQDHDRDEKVKGLWEEFNQKYEDQAEDPDRVEFAATKVAKRAQARGVDLERYMFISRDQFLADVAKEHRDIFGAPEVDEGEPEPKPNRKARPTNDNDDEEDTNRTGGMFGGIDAGGGLNGRGRQQDTPSDMIKDLQEIQRKSGFY